MRPDMTISSIASELISSSGLISGEVLVQAHIMANKMNIPFGRALVMSGHLGEGDLTSLLQASQMVKQGEITKEMAVPVVIKAISECLPFFSIVHKVEDVPRRKLAELLIDAKVLSEDELDSLTEQCQQNNLQLGRLLILTETLTTKELKAALELLVLVRGKCISRSIAIRAFKHIFASHITVLEALTHCDVEIPAVMPKIGELLCEAGILSETEVLNAAEIGIESNKPIGEILAERNLVPPLVLKAALRLQSMVLSERLNSSQAQELLRQAHSHQVSVEKVLQELGEFKKNIVDFLKRSRKISDKDLRTALENFPSLVDDPATALLANNAIDLKALKVAVHSLNLVRTGVANMDQAIMVFHYCLRTGTSVKEARKELTWNSSISEARSIVAKIAEVA
ncbi:MAG: hypothetical protein JST89_01575 [Cyanobacteria bacterium SZAS-4]|nr:hypothetical protein [Cyanobacteria bacterium SZAS-4]